MNWCEYCEGATTSSKTTIRITKDGREIFIKVCEICGLKTEIEFYKGPTVSFRTSRKKNGKQHNKKSTRTSATPK